MHPEAMGFVRDAVARWPDLARGRVVELGAYDVNGTPRDLFPDAAEYVGVDCREGPGVDVVALAQEALPERAGAFDMCVSTEMIEHDPHWRESLANGLRLLRPGGVLVVTCAGAARAPHDIEKSPEPGHYENVPAAALQEWAAGQGLAEFDAIHVRADHDTHFWAVRP